MKLGERIKTKFGALAPKRRQYLMAALLLGGGFMAIWAVLVMSSSSGEPQPKKPGLKLSAITGPVTNITVPGTIAPIDEWVGNAGRKLAQYDADKLAQGRSNQERKAFEESISKRMADFERSQQSAMAAGAAQGPKIPPVATDDAKAGMPPAPLPGSGRGMPAGAPPLPLPPAEPAEAPVLRISLPDPAKKTAAPAAAAPASGNAAAGPNKGPVETFLPVSFTRGILLAGMDAPTGGQAQSNPLPALIRLTDNAVLPSRYRSLVKECFVVASGYGDISSERALMRTVNLSCIRHDGTALEVDIKGNVYGPDGKLGVRGRLVTKQGQLLANALRAGIVGGIGQGFSQSGTSISSSPLGAVSTQSGGSGEQMRRGLGSGVGHAMDHLADYYIRLAEQTFPVIEVDAGIQVEVVITKGVQLGAPLGRPDDDDGDAVLAKREVEK